MSSNVAKKIIKNAVQCLTCGTEIQSRYLHNWVRCNCPADSETWVFVDGGQHYARRGAGNNAMWIDLTEYEL